MSAARILHGETLVAVEFCYESGTPLVDILDDVADYLDETELDGLVHSAHTEGCPTGDFHMHLVFTVSVL